MSLPREHRAGWVFVWALLLSGCAEIRIHRTSSPFLWVKEPVVLKADSVFFGLKNLSPATDLSQACPKGWESIRTRETLLQAVLRVASLNLYDAWTVDVACRIPPQTAPS